MYSLYAQGFMKQKSFHRSLSEGLYFYRWNYLLASATTDLLLSWELAFDHTTSGASWLLDDYYIIVN